MPSSSDQRRQSDFVVVETTRGKLRGMDSGSVVSFKGIRYGQSTAGANRFRPPLPPEKWAGIPDALEWGNSAPQQGQAAHPDPFYSWYSAIREISEDCLFLNVFTPRADDNRRPVMVWLHGGGWRMGAGTAPGTDGSGLVEEEDVVVVTLNHRLGALGFFAIGRDDDRFADAGNAGLLDILLALRWVHDNIAEFGGDPSNVTIFGQSGGAAKVAALMTMPPARALFHRAIIQSSSGGLRIADYDEAAKFMFDIARQLGFESSDGAALQKVPLDKLMGAVKQSPWYFRPVIDDRTFHGHPFTAAAPAFPHIPTMVGCTNTETTYYMRRNPASFTMDLPEVQARLVQFLQVDRAVTQRVIEAYRDADSYASPADILIAVTTDYLFKRNTYHMAALQDTAAAPSYAFVFAFETPVEGGILRSPHTLEIPFIFGTAEIARAIVGTEPDIEPMTRIMMATWAQFARSGNPNNPLVPDWRPYAQTGRPIMALQLRSELLLNSRGRARATLDELPFYEYGQSRDNFWSA